MTPWFQQGLTEAAIWIGLIFLTAYLWAWFAAPPRRGRYRWMVKRREPIQFVSRERAGFCGYGFHSVDESELIREDDYFMCRHCSDLRKRTVESFMPKGAA